MLDGAMGTMLQAENLTSDDFGGEKYEGCNDYLVLTKPDVISLCFINFFLLNSNNFFYYNIILLENTNKYILIL